VGSPLVTANATVLCPHGGQVTIVATGSRVTIDGQPVALQPDTTTVAGCAFTVPTGKPQPCVTVRWLTATTRVTVSGVPVLLQSSSSLASSAEQIPQGPANVVSTQLRVTGV